MRKQLGLPLLALSVLMLSGCATTASTEQPNPYPDPLQPYNRAVFKFNDDFTKAFVIPVTDAYTYSVPSVGRNAIHNFFQNAGTLPDIANDILQLNFHYMVIDTARLIINTTLGVGGLFDVASQNGIYAHPQSFGYTLEKWGWKNSSYFVIPIIGPSTVNGVVGMVPNIYMSPTGYIKPIWARHVVNGVNIVQVASDVVPQQQALMAISLDPYVALRNAYMQNNEYINQQIQYDGHPPAEDMLAHPMALLPTDAHSVTEKDVKRKKAKKAINNAMKKALEVNPYQAAVNAPVTTS